MSNADIWNSKIIPIVGTVLGIIGSLAMGLGFLVMGCAPYINNWKIVWLVFFAFMAAGIFLNGSAGYIIYVYKLIKNNQSGR
ncbi:MAG: hypothetical protein AB1485_06045 [Candidatus Thermoplasmatota archaeon]